MTRARRLLGAVAALSVLAVALGAAPAGAEDATPQPSSTGTSTTAPTPSQPTVAVAPGAPSILNVVGGTASGQLAITYAPPAADGGSAITSYEASIDKGSTWWPCAGTTGECVLTNLRNGTQYRVSVRALN